MDKKKMSFWLKLLLPVVTKLVEKIIKEATPEVRKSVISAIQRLEKKASATPNEFDNLLVNVLKALVGMNDA